MKYLKRIKFRNVRNVSLLSGTCFTERHRRNGEFTDLINTPVYH